MSDSFPFELFVATRYLLAKRKQAFISVISFISVLGVLVGVMAVLIALALMTGLQGELRDRIVGSSAQVYVFKILDGIQDTPAETAKLKTVPRVVGVAPALLGKGIINAGSDRTAFASIKGIDPALEATVTNIRQAMRSGTLEAIHAGPEEPDGIVLGTDLAKSLEVQVGDKVHVVTPDQILTPMGMMQHTRAFKVVGTFSLGLYEFDSEYALVDLPVAERLFGKGQPAFLEVRVDDMWASAQVAADIPKRLGDEYVTQDWRDMNKSLFSALWLEKIAMAIAIGLIIMVAALNIVASLVLLVMEKSRDIAILRTMGASAPAIRRIFIFQGLTIGLIGTISGTILGLVVCKIADHYQLIKLSSEVYQITYLPFRVLPLDVTIVVISAVVVCLLATIYPARQAGRLDPAEALRYE